jgi:Abi-like protein
MATNQPPAQPPAPGPNSVRAGETAQLADTATETVPAAPPAQPVFEYNDRQLKTLVGALSSDRLQPYVVHARSADPWLIIRLYERNTKLSEALYGVVQALEVLLRNRIHGQMMKDIWAADWYDKVAFLEPEQNEIADAKKAIADRIKPVTPGRVVAELNLGFWVRMFSGQYEKEFWVKNLHKLYAASRQRKAVHERLVNIKTLRNRIAHHETLIRRKPEKDYADTLEAIEWLSPTVLAWVKSTNCFEARFAERIPKKPKVEAAEAAAKSAAQTG